MTCVCYRDGEAAADRWMIDAWTRTGQAPKIAKRGPLLAGVTGETAFGRVFLDWFRGPEFEGWLDSDGSRYPNLVNAAKPDKETHGYIFLPDHSVIRFEQGQPPFRTVQPFFAVGSGAWVAVGAMEMGASAAQAVAAAHKWDIGTSGSYDVLRSAD